MARITGISPDIASITVGVYRVQLRSRSLPYRWFQVFMPDLDTAEDRTIPAIFTDVTAGEAFLSHMRDTHPRTVYRMVRDITITEIVCD